MKYGSTENNNSATSTSCNSLISNGTQNNYLATSTGNNPNNVMNYASSGLTLSDQYNKNSDLLVLKNTEMLSARNLQSKSGAGLYLKE